MFFVYFLFGGNSLNISINIKLQNSNRSISMEHESDGNTNCNWHARYSHRRNGSEAGGIGNKKSPGDHPNYSIVEIGQYIKKSPGDLKRLVPLRL